MDKRKWFPLICIITGALMAELIVFNFTSWRSLFFGNRIDFKNIAVEDYIDFNNADAKTPDGCGIYTAGENGLTIRIPNVDAKIHNIFLDMDFTEDSVVPYTISLTDDGNYYPYELPERVLLPQIKKSLYTNIYPAGKVKSIDVHLSLPEGSTAALNKITCNVRYPFMFSPLRFLVIFGILSLFYKAACADKWVNDICQGTRKQSYITAATIAALMLISWGLAHINPICITSPWPHHKQYQELVEVMAEGHFYLDTEPSEELVSTDNPYDTIYLQANGIDYLADYAYYDGKYYVYFGVVPELLLYLPFYMLTGHHLPNYMAVFLFYCGFILSVFALFREVIKRWFVHTPHFIYLTVCTLTVSCGNYLFMIARPDLYDTPIIAANMFTVCGLWLWIKGKYSESIKARRICYFLGSLSMALVAGCRPQMLLFSFLAIPLFWEEIKKVLPKDAVAFCLPYLLVAAGIMYYNAARFGSVLDFGATYSLTSNDMTKRTFNLHQTLLGIWHYFLRPPVIESYFPFLQGIQITSGSYMGKLNAEYTYGGILASNVFLWFLLYFNRGKLLLKERGIYVFSIISVCISVLISIVDVTGAGILQRYMTDMVWGVWLAAALLLFACSEHAAKHGAFKSLMVIITAVCILQAAYGFGVIIGNGDLSVNVRTSNPNLYYYLYELFRI